MHSHVFMSDAEEYKNKLRNLLSIAYKKGQFDKYYFILESEIKQMLDGNIPYFSLNSVSCCLNNNETATIFQYNSIENIIYRLQRLSEAHQHAQIEHITKWLQITRSN